MHSILEQLIATSFIHAERFITLLLAVCLDVGLTDELRSGFLLGLSDLAGLRADELSIGLRAIEPDVEFSHLLLFSAAMPLVMFVFMIKFIPFIKFDL